jgi:RTX calcium-binding nonapeptide repeat (4 copies)
VELEVHWMHRRLGIAIALIAIGALLMFWAPAVLGSYRLDAQSWPASSGTGQFKRSSASVKVSGSTLIVTAAPGARDNLAIRRPPRAPLQVTDYPDGFYTGSPVQAGPGCAPGGTDAAKCNRPITRIRVSSGDEADRVLNATSTRAWLYGGAGKDTLSGGSNDDTLVGGSGNDQLIGGPGVDVLEGMAGHDQLLARDGISDAVIDCGAGSDMADLDRLPKDPNFRVKGCERKTRH